MASIGTFDPWELVLALEDTVKAYRHNRTSSAAAPLSPDDFLSRFDGIVFDCDGTLVDTMHGHYVAWQLALAHHSIHTFTETHFYEFAGMPATDILAELEREQGLPPGAVDPEKFAAKKVSIFEEVALPGLKEIPCVVDIAREAKRRGIPIAVSSGGDKPDVLRSLEVTGLQELFSVVVTREDTEHGKPSPDPFLEAARQLGVDPRRCLGLEDADKGLQALDAAGMCAVDVRRFNEYPLAEYFIKNRPELRKRALT